MNRFALLLSAAFLSATLIATPSQAARVLYAYTGANGMHTVSISDGFYQKDGPQPDTVTCAGAGAFCDQAAFLIYRLTFPFGDGRFDRDQLAISVPGAMSGGFDDAPGGQTGEHLSHQGVLSIRELADSDVVYSYVDELGQSAVVISDGFYRGGEIQPTLVSCFDGDKSCDRARIFFTSFHVPGVVTLDYAVFGGDHFRPVAAPFHPDDFATPGVHFAEPGIHALGRARLAVVGPVTTPLSAVPEPGTWALTVLGFGLLGVALRRRGQAAMAPATDFAARGEAW